MSKPHRPLCAATLRWAAVQLSEARKRLVEELDLAGFDELGNVVDEHLIALNGDLASAWNRLEGRSRDYRVPLLYFGTWRGPGHYYFYPNGILASDKDTDPIPFPVPDGNFQPANGQREGVAKLSFFDGWTILAWWDRSQDQRPGSCGALVYGAEVGWDAMVSLLHGVPQIKKRIGPLAQWHGPSQAEVGHG